MNVKREKNEQDATNLTFIIQLLSQHVSGIMMPEICCDRSWIINIRLVASCSFFSLFILYKYLVFKVSVRFEGNVFLKEYIYIYIYIYI